MKKLRLRIFSDLHLEHHWDGGLSFIRGLKDCREDIIILAGDISNFSSLRFVFTLLSEKFKRPIISVPGNHCWYGHRISDKMPTHPEVDILDNGICEIYGKRFVGSTLWFEPTPFVVLSNGKHTKDYNQIVGLREQHEIICERAVNFLKESVRPGDIVVTHYLPHSLCIHKQYLKTINSRNMNDYFVNRAAEPVFDQEPALWIHGHGHTSVRKRIGKTRVIANPMGYPWEINPQFNENLIIQV